MTNEVYDYTQTMTDLYEAINELKIRVLAERHQDKYYNYYRNLKRSFLKLENEMVANGDL